MIMHHIALYTPCIALFNFGHLDRSRGAGIEISSGGSTMGVRQASSGSDANIIVIKASLDAFNHAPYLLIFNLALCSIMIVY
jgi:hypothetical protein